MNWKEKFNKMKTMTRILHGWYFMRVLRLAVGIIIIWQAIATREWAPGLVGGFLVLLALANIGCCGPAGCSTPGRSKAISGKTREDAADVLFEEIENR